MNFVDIVVLAVIALSALLALGRGFVKEVLSLFGWVGAAVGTIAIFTYVPEVKEFARAQIAEEVLADIACVVALFVVLLIVLGFFNHAISSRIHASALGPLDKSLGLVFGLARGVILVALAYMVMSDWLLPNEKDRPEVIRQARTEPYVKLAAEHLKAVIPESWKARASSMLDEGAKAVEQGQELNETLDKLKPGLAPTPGESPGDSPQNGGQDGTQNPAGTQDGTQLSPAGNQGGQEDQSGYKDAERKDLERLIQVQTQ